MLEPHEPSSFSPFWLVSFLYLSAKYTTRSGSNKGLGLTVPNIRFRQLKAVGCSAADWKLPEFLEERRATR